MVLLNGLSAANERADPGMDFEAPFFGHGEKPFKLPGFHGRMRAFIIGLGPGVAEEVESLNSSLGCLIEGALPFIVAHLGLGVDPGPILERDSGLIFRRRLDAAEPGGAQNAEAARP
jgi:hypothetical protein